MKRMDFRAPFIRYATCWFVFPFLFFSASRGKLGTYILPCFPPFAILVKAGLRSHFERGREEASRIGASALAVALGVVAVAFALLQLFDLHGLGLYAQVWKWALASAGLLSVMLLLLFASREALRRGKLMLYGAAPVLCMLIAPFVVPDRAVAHKSPVQILLSHSRRAQPESILVSDRITASAVCWYYKRSDVHLLGSAGELSYGMGYEDSRQRLLGLDDLRELIGKHRGTSRVTLFEESDRYERQKKELPDPILEDSSGEGGFVFLQF